MVSAAVCSRSLAVPATSRCGGGLGMLVLWPGSPWRTADHETTPGRRRSPRLQAEKKQLELELAKARFVVDVEAKLHAYAGDSCPLW